MEHNSIKFSDYKNDYYNNNYGNSTVDIDVAYKDGLFENISKCRHSTQDNTGRQLFYSEDSKEIYDYFKSIGVKEVHTDFKALKFGVDNWCSTWFDGYGMFVQLKSKKKRRNKYKKLPNNNTEKADHEHLNIKGQKNIGKWG